ncbi:hypothetical protein [Nostoc sp.]|uniref:hypothetical protein n=1 Tax=Nostoc sp. TaxID=1180 RepID=UPI0035944B16
MTYQIYSQQQLQHKSIARLKQIYSEIGCTLEVTDKRCKDSWINAIGEYQASKIQKLTPATPDEQTLAQAELEHHITTQAQSIAPEELRAVEISFYDHEIYYGTQLIATITYNDDLTQPWVVLVEDVEKFRANTWARCYRYISWHHQDGTLNAPLPFGEAELVTEHKQLPPQKPELPATISNEIMAQIFNECEKFGFEILDDGIYRDDQKLGEVGCSSGKWWVIRASSVEQKVACESVAEAVRALSVVKPLDWQELLDKPFDQLSTQEWLLMMESEPVREMVAA